MININLIQDNIDKLKQNKVFLSTTVKLSTQKKQKHDQFDHFPAQLHYQQHRDRSNPLKYPRKNLIRNNQRQNSNFKLPIVNINNNRKQQKAYENTNLNSNINININKNNKSNLKRSQHQEKYKSSCNKKIYNQNVNTQKEKKNNKNTRNGNNFIQSVGTYYNQDFQCQNLKEGNVEYIDYRDKQRQSFGKMSNNHKFLHRQVQNFNNNHKNRNLIQNNQKYSNFQNYQNQQYPQYYPEQLEVNRHIPLHKDKNKLQSYYKIKSEDLWMISKPIPFDADQKLLTPYQKHVFFIKQSHLNSFNQEKENVNQKMQTNSQNLNIQENKKSRYMFKHSQKLNEKQKKIINAWLISMYGQITSDNYRRLMTSVQGNVKQSKVFESKNIIFNMSFFIQKLSQVFTQQQNQKRYRNIKKEFQVLKFIDKQSKQIISTQKIKYPQSQSSGGSAQLKAILAKTDKTKDLLRCDLLFHFVDQQKKPVVCFNDNQENLSFSICVSYIMKVINYISGITSLPFAQSNINYTNFDAFKEFINKLFTQNQKLKQQTNNIKSCFRLSQTKKVKSINLEQFRQILKITGKFQSQTEYKIGTKLSLQMEKFSEEEIQKAIFEIKDGTILRIMTKWVEELRSKIKQKEHFLTNGNLLKKKNGGIFLVMLQDQKTKTQIRKKINQIYSEIESKFEQIYSNFLKIETQILNLKYNSESLNSLDTNIGIIASETQMCIGNYLLNQLFHLIKGLQKISLELQKIFKQRLDLASFTVGDLMRCKCKGHMQQIKSIYQTLAYMSHNIPQLLQIVRLKDRLDKPDKDILINVLFMGKIQCQIQLSVWDNHYRKDISAMKNEFNHFLYELHRAQFGILSECCCIIAKNDPISKIVSFPHQHIIAEDYQKIIQRQNIHEKKQKFEPFFCFECNSLVRNYNPNFFKQDQQHFVCNNCFQKNQQWDKIQMKNFKSSLLKNKENQILVKNLKKVQKIKQISQIPEKGIMISKLNEVPQYEYFQLENYPKNTSNYYLFSKSFIDKKSAKKLFQITQKQSKKIIKNLQNEFYIFQPKNGFKLVQKQNLIYFSKTQQNPEQQIKLCEKIQIKNFIIMINIQNIKDVVNKQRNTLKFQNMLFLKETFDKIKGSMSFKEVRYLHLNGLKKQLNQDTLRIIIQTLGTEHIQKIFIQNSQIESFPSKLFKGICLQQLNFQILLELNTSYTLLQKLEIKCPSLQFLYCSNSKLGQLDMSFFPNLQILDCSSNEITDIKNLSLMNRIHHMDCSYNKLKKLLFALSNFNQQRTKFPLKNLVCTNNKINQILFPNNMAPNLQILNCSENDFSNSKFLQLFTESEKKFESIVVLNLSSCCLDSQRFSIKAEALPKLRILDIFNNKNIKNLSFCYSKQNSSILQYINAGNNKLQTATFNHLSKLTLINLSFSEVKKLAVENLPKLKKIKCNKMQNYIEQLHFKNLPHLQKIQAQEIKSIIKNQENLNESTKNIIAQLMFYGTKSYNNENKQINLKNQNFNISDIENKSKLLVNTKEQQNLIQNFINENKMITSYNMVTAINQEQIVRKLIKRNKSILQWLQDSNPEEYSGEKQILKKFTKAG